MQLLRKISKRQRFILVAFLLTVLLAFISFLPNRVEIWAVLLFSLVSALGTKYLLRLDWAFPDFVYLIFPELLSLSTGFVQYLFPHTLLWFKVGFWLFFGVIFYLLFLSLNIFRVSEKRGSIPLLRPAKTALFLIAVLIAFYGFSVILKGVYFFPLQTFLVTIFPLGLSFALFGLFDSPTFHQPHLFQSTRWQVSRQVGGASLLISWSSLGIFLALSFLPLKSFFRGLMLSATFYTALSLGREYFAHRLDRRLVLEYFALILVLGIVVFWFSPQ